MDAKTYRHHPNFPHLDQASDQEVLAVALTLLPAHILEEALQPNHTEQNSLTPLLHHLDKEKLSHAQSLLLGKSPLKTQPIIARDTGRIFRAQGRPPKDIDPIYVETEAEALKLLSE